MDNEFTEYLNQNWNEKYKVGSSTAISSSSSQHQPATGYAVDGSDSSGPESAIPNTNFLRSAFLNELNSLQFQQQDQIPPSSQPAPSDLDDRVAFLQQQSQIPQTHHPPNGSQLQPSLHQRSVDTVGTNVPCPKLIDIKNMKPNVALSTSSPIPSTAHSERPLLGKSVENSLRNVAFPSNTNVELSTSNMANYNAMLAARSNGSYRNDCVKLIDSTTPPPNTQCTSSSGNLIHDRSTVEHEKKAANSIRGRLYFSRILS